MQTEDNGTPANEEIVEKEAEQTENDTPTEDATEEGNEPDAGDELPEWAQKERTKLRAESANYRTRLREAEQKLAEAKSLEEVDTIISDLKAEREQVEETARQEARELLVENVALKFKLPAKIAKRLQGDTREEIEADAKELSEYAEIEDDEEVTLEGGLAPRSRAESLSITELRARHGTRRR